MKYAHENISITITHISITIAHMFPVMPSDQPHTIIPVNTPYPSKSPVCTNMESLLSDCTESQRRKKTDNNNIL
jgi:hypothetical protein